MALVAPACRAGARSEEARMIKIRAIKFTDYVISQGSDEEPERLGVMEDHTAGEVVTWAVNGEEQASFTYPEFGAFMQAAQTLDEAPHKVKPPVVAGPEALAQADAANAKAEERKKAKSAEDARAAEIARKRTVEIEAHPAALTDAELAEIRARHAAATPGVWESRHGYVDGGVGRKRGSLIRSLDADWSEEDASFAAHAHQDIPRLLAEIDRLRNPPAPPPPPTYVPPTTERPDGR